MDKKIGPTLNNHKRVNTHRGCLFIISGPSGAGKTTLRQVVLNRFKNILYSVSYTTRSPRTGEQDGVDYNFTTTDEFSEGIKNGKWTEWAEVHGNFYGTSSDFIGTALAAGKDILLDIDVQGTLQVLKQFPDSITIFIMPPSLQTLKDRMESRGTDSEQVMLKRLRNAEKEMGKKDLYRYIIVNDKLPEAISEIISIIEKYR